MKEGGEKPRSVTKQTLGSCLIFRPRDRLAWIAVP
jgi:hypothetical protein